VSYFKCPFIEVAGASTLTAGLILFCFMIVILSAHGAHSTMLPTSEMSLLRQPLMFIIVILLLFSCILFISSSSYSSGLSKMGASITSIIGSSSILMTLIIQLVLHEFGIANHLPENMFLAGFGGVAGFLGIYMIHIPRYSIPITTTTKS
jgi:hypothetical protein